ncbi:MAG: glutamate racemase [Candidatus Desulforudis sp.]|nr:glutamate racemase [Desulforudis sp.]
MSRSIIGLFDSGVGGLTVAEEVFRTLPGQRVIYFGDTLNVPYGGRPVAELISFAERIIRFLFEQGAGYIIFACNTSSAVSLQLLRERFDVPMIGLIEPGAAEAVRLSVNGNIGVIATEATVAAGAYSAAIKRINPRVRVCSRAAPRLVPLVEAGELDSPRVEQALREYLGSMRDEGIDTLILGCSHYPFLRPAIERILGSGVTLVDPAAATVDAAARDMSRRGLLTGNPGRSIVLSPGHRYFVSGEAAGFVSVAKKFLGREPAPVTEICLLR